MTGIFPRVSSPLLRPMDFGAGAMVRMLERGGADARECLRAWEGK